MIGRTFGFGVFDLLALPVFFCLTAAPPINFAIIGGLSAWLSG
jgi:hypothetical protein